MPTTIATLACVLLYSGCAIHQIHAIRGGRPPLRGPFYGALLSALALHTWLTWQLVFTDAGVNLSFEPMLMLVSWMVTTIAVGSSLAEPIENLFALLLPLTALVVFGVYLAPLHHPARPLHPGISAHVLTSIMAYSTLCLTALQAILLGRQERLLKQRRNGGLLLVLPPLQTMEKLLFQGVWIGMALLTTSIATGAWFLENLFAQHLAHKTVFSLGAWLIFATLLVGRYRLGWRGTRAAHWTLWGFGALMLAFVGTKLVMELLLGRA